MGFRGAATAVAMIYPKPEKGGRGKKGLETKQFGISKTNLFHARAVLA